MEHDIVKHRDIDVITSEIQDLCNEAKRTVLLYAVEIGRRLVEAKEVLPHGEWGKWLEHSVHFSQSTANKHMQLFEAYGSRQMSLLGAELNSETFTNLSYSQALKLLAVPENEREEFVKKNNVEELSTRELDRLIKERDEAKKKAEEAEKLLNDTIEDAREINMRKRQLEAITEEQKAALERAKAEADEVRTELRQAKTEEKKAKDELKQLKDNPEVPKELQDKLRSEAVAKAAEEIKAGIAEAEKRALAAETARTLAESEAEAARSKAEELRRSAAAANPAVSEFKILYTQVQETMGKMLERIQKIDDDELRNKLISAVNAVLEQYSQDFKQELR